MTWQELEAELFRRLSGEPPGLRLPAEPPPGLGGFFWQLLRVLEGDEAALGEARAAAGEAGPVLRYLVEATAHAAFPERHPAPGPELAAAWRDHLRARRFLAALREPEPVVLPPAASLPLAAGPAEAKTRLVLAGQTFEAPVRFGGLEARPFTIAAALTPEAWRAVEAHEPKRARVFYRTPSGEAWAEAQELELFPPDRLLVLAFPEFWLYDPEGNPQDERVLTKVVLE